MSVNIVNNDGSLSRVAGGTLYADSPIGTISPFGGATAPTGWLLCQGQAVSRATYAELFAVIGTSFGEGDESTTFNIPDLREATTKGIGENPNGESHVKTGGLSLGEFIDDRMQSHTHGVQNGYDGSNEGSAERGDARHGYSIRTNNATGRTGDTTEVKAVGVNYIIKAKQVAIPADFIDAVDDTVNEALSGFARTFSLVSVNNSIIHYEKSRVVGGIVTICADIIVQSGSYLVKENAIANVPNLGPASISYILPCLYRNTGSGAEEPGYAMISTSGNLFPYYTKSEYNEIRINASYSSKN